MNCPFWPSRKSELTCKAVRGVIHLDPEVASETRRRGEIGLTSAKADSKLRLHHGKSWLIPPVHRGNIIQCDVSGHVRRKGALTLSVIMEAQLEVQSKEQEL